MVNFTILAGGYTTFVASYLFSNDTNPPSFTFQGQSTTGASPSWIASHPVNASILYAVNELPQGMLQTYTVGDKGALSGPVSQASSGGDSPAFCGPLSTGQVAIMNYNSGNGKIIPTDPTNPEILEQNASLITFPKPAPGQGEGVSHPHMAVEHAGEVFVPDLGGDTIWRLGNDGADNWTIHGSIPSANGTGPRHMAIYNNEIYLLHEVSSTLTVQAIPTAPNGTSPLLANVSIVPPDLPAGASMAAAEILIPAPSASFPTPYIYVSNRNIGTQDARGDTIAIFQRTDSGLELVQQVYTGLDQIRGMMSSPGEARWIVAAGFAGSAGVKVFERVDQGKNLSLVATDTTLPNRTSFVWLPEGNSSSSTSTQQNQARSTGSALPGWHASALLGAAALAASLCTSML